jgi:hypothetical protein
MNASSLEDMFLRLEACGKMLRVDENVWPTMFKCATISLPELDRIKRVGKIIRQGRVVSIGATEVTLEKGTYTPVSDTLYIDCTADGLAKLEPVPVFSGKHITLQSVRYCQQVFSAALIAHVEATYDDEKVKNALCSVVPHPEEPRDFLDVSLGTYLNAFRWYAEPRTGAWLMQARLDVTNAQMPEDPIEAAKVASSMPDQLQAICEKLRYLINQVPKDAETAAA